MEKQLTPGTWNTIPERRFQDYAVPKNVWTADYIHATFLRVGKTALAPGSSSLQFPPLKAFAPKQVTKGRTLHQHRNIEVGVVIQGEMTIWWEGVTSRCPAGTLFVIPPGIRYMPHVQTTDQTLPHSVIWLTIHKSYAVIHMCSMEGNRHQLSEYFSFTNSMMVLQARIMAQELADRAPDYQMVVRVSLTCLLTWLARVTPQPLSQFAQPKTDNGGKEQKFSERVESYLRSQYHRPITLPQVAQAVGCSPAYLCRRFRESTGTTPFHLLREIRIEVAKRLLASELPVSRVAEMVGFEDPLYFSKVFAKSAGKSPQKFRSSMASTK